MNKLFKNNKIVLVSRIILGIIFIYASIDKIINPLIFSNSIDNYHITPVQINNLVALILPWVELIIGLCLLLGVFIDGAAILTIILLLWFIFILSQALARGINLDCGCFDLVSKDLKDGNLRLEMYKRIFEDFVFLIMAFIVKYRKK